MEPHDPGPLPWSTSDWSEAAMGESLRLAAESLCVFGGFRVAAIAVVRDDAVVPIAVAGAARLVDGDGRPLEVAEVLGQGMPVALFEETLLPLAEDWGLLKYVPHHRSQMPELGWRIESYAGTGWHPHDLLLVPVRDAGGQLRGMLSMDEPIGGHLPDPEQRTALERYAAQASRVVLTALEREELAERQRLAVAARRLLGRAADGDDPEAILTDVSDELVAAFQLAGVRAVVYEGAERRILVETAGGLGELDPEVYRFSRQSAEWLWQHRLVGMVGRDQLLNFDGPAEDLERIRELNRSLGLESILLVPLGAGDTCLGSIAFYRAEGGPRWTEAECAAAQEIGHDLGRLLSVHRALRLEHAAVEELRALDGYRSQLIATVAHELRNPIAAIRGNLELAAAQLQDDVEGAEAALEAVGRGADRIGRIVENLLLLAATNDPNVSPRREPIDLTPPVQAGVQLAVDSARRAAAEVATDLPDEPLVATADPDGIEQVVVNLVGNALKYTPRGRTVSVCLRRQGAEAVLTVSDEGIGISPEDQERIFTEFFRSTDPAARRQPGTGLGLAIVDRIVEQHGGRIDVDSAPGRGSTFRVVLPLR